MKPIAVIVLAALVALTLFCAPVSAESEPYLLITSVPRYGIGTAASCPERSIATTDRRSTSTTTA